MWTMNEWTSEWRKTCRKQQFSLIGTFGWNGSLAMTAQHIYTSASVSAFICSKTVNVNKTFVCVWALDTMRLCFDLIWYPKQDANTFKWHRIMWMWVACVCIYKMCALSFEQDVPQLVSLFSYYDKIYDYNSLYLDMFLVLFVFIVGRFTIPHPYTNTFRGAAFVQENAFDFDRVRQSKKKTGEMMSFARDGHTYKFEPGKRRLTIVCTQPTRIAGWRAIKLKNQMA